MVVEVNLQNINITFVDDDIYFSNLLLRVEGVTVTVISGKNLASLAIIESEAESRKIIPLNLCNCQISQLLQTFVINLLQVWNTQKSVYFINTLSNNSVSKCY